MKRIHYAWIVAASGLVMTAVVAGMALNCFSLFVVPITVDLGFSRAEFGVCQTINALGFAVTALISGWLFKQIPLKRIMQISSILIVCAYFLYSRLNRLWMFYLCAMVGSMSASLLTWVPLSVIINNWFVKKRAFAIGFSFMGSGVGGMIFSSVGSRLIEMIGWRQTFVVMACVLMLTLVPLVFFVIYVHPKEKGLMPYGYGGEADQADEGENSGVSIREALLDGRFYGIIFLVTAFGFATNGFTATFVPHFEDSGYSPVRAGTFYSVYMLLLAAGKMIMGSLFDRLGARKTTFLGVFLMLVTLISLILCRYPVFIALMLMASGLGNCYATVGLPVLARAVYGKRDYVTFNGILNTAGNIGSTLAPALMGLMRDASGTYAIGYSLFAGLILAGGVCAAVCLPSREGEKS